MVRRRIEYDPEDGTLSSAIAHTLAGYRSAHAEGWLVAAAGDADEVHKLSRQLADNALLEADEIATRRQLADGLGGVTHGTVNYRLKRAQERLHAEATGEDIED